MVGLGIYQLATQDQDLLWQQVLTTVEELKTQLRDGKTRAGLISGAAFIGTYGAIAASSHLGNVATLGLLGLGSVNLATLVLLLYHLGAGDKGDPSRQGTGLDPQASFSTSEVDNAGADHSEADNLDAHWQHLTASHPLKRFLAVRELTAWGLALAPRERTDRIGESGQSLGHQGDREYLIDCFHLMLSQEQEPTIRTALREALQRLAPAQRPHPSPHQLGPGEAALPPLAAKVQPVELAPALAPVLQRQVDYVEP